MNVQVVILAAGLGSRLGRPLPKPLTRLADGRTIMEQQLDNIFRVFGPDTRVTAVVGFKRDLVMESFPDLLFSYNEAYDRTNTSKSLLKALKQTLPGGVVWLNGDVVFDFDILEGATDLVEAGRSFVCVNGAPVGDEEVSYTVDGQSHLTGIGKRLPGGLGEAIGINFVGEADKQVLVGALEECEDQDYFERGIELTIRSGRAIWQAHNIGSGAAVEIDFAEDLERANAHLQEVSDAVQGRFGDQEASRGS